MKVIKDLIDYQFEEFTIKAFYIQFIVYLMFYIIPLVLLVYTKSRLNQTIYITSCLSIQAVIAVIEAITIKQKGLSAYASDMWNKVDLTMLFLNVIFFSNLARRDPHEDTPTYTIMLNLISIPFAFLKLMHFLRGIFESFGQLISLIVTCLKDISIFLLFFAAWIMFFMIFYRIAGVEFDKGDYPELDSNLVLFF